MGNDALLSGSTKDVEKWADFIYDRIRNMYIPMGLHSWFWHCDAALQDYITENHERPQFKAYYSSFYKALEKLVDDGMDFGILYASSFSKPSNE